MTGTSNSLQQAYGWGRGGVCLPHAGAVVPSGEGSKDSRHLAPSWTLALRAGNQLGLSLWGHRGTGPTRLRPFLGNGIVRPTPQRQTTWTLAISYPPHRCDHRLDPPPLATCALAPPAPPRRGRREGLLGELGFHFGASHWRYLWTPGLGSAGRAAIDLEM